MGSNGLGYKTMFQNPCKILGSGKRTDQGGN